MGFLALVVLDVLVIQGTQLWAYRVGRSGEIRGGLCRGSSCTCGGRGRRI